jgi:putative nucleotidyltransferase with HDIG domain
MTTVDDIIKSIDMVPPLSPTSNALLSLSSRDDYSASDVADIVELDPFLSSQLLKLVNSAAYSVENEIKSIPRAVSYVGSEFTVAMALKLSAGDFYESDLKGYEATVGAFWRHSVRCALNARFLASRSDSQVQPDVAYCAGLLHDIGKGPLSCFMQGHAHSLVSSVDDMTAKDFRDAEYRKFGIDHCSLGVAIAEKWKLPQDLRMVIEWHHDPSSAPEEGQELVYLIHVADFLSMMEGGSTGADGMLYTFDEAYTNFFNIERNDLDNLILDVDKEFESVMGIFESYKGGGNNE